jgi:glycosyltransferase involved in cell wall biosynthesis
VDLYNSVDCLLFPSFYEGFGWPPLEAMACGTPVVTSDAASLPEVVGEAGIMVSPTDLAAIADALNRVLTDEVLRDCLVRKGLERVRGFSWDLTAQAVGRVYERVLATH